MIRIARVGGICLPHTQKKVSREILQESVRLLPDGGQRVLFPRWFLALWLALFLLVLRDNAPEALPTWECELHPMQRGPLRSMGCCSIDGDVLALDAWAVARDGFIGAAARCTDILALRVPPCELRVLLYYYIEEGPPCFWRLSVWALQGHLA